MIIKIDSEHRYWSGLNGSYSKICLRKRLWTGWLLHHAKKPRNSWLH